MMRSKLTIISISLLLILLIACQKQERLVSPEESLSQNLHLPSIPYHYADVILPDFLSDFPGRREDNMPEDNVITDWGATLGRVLFYEKALSLNNTISCASCHHQENNFADPVAFSLGFDGVATTRNSMSLTNARYYEHKKFFWDERAATLEQQILFPIQDHIEMGLTIDEMISRLEDRPYYAFLFEKAFGDTNITPERVAKATAQFIRSIVSFTSKFDKAVIASGITQSNLIKSPLVGLTDIENRGVDIFFNIYRGCTSCHSFGFQIADLAMNNGLDNEFIDLGVGGFTGNDHQMGKFKVPSLRNIAVSGPYMHDGRFESLEEVLEHYSSGIQYSPTLDVRFRGIGSGNTTVRQMDLTEEEKEGLIAFLHTLTDEEFLRDEKFSDPFIK